MDGLETWKSSRPAHKTTGVWPMGRRWFRTLNTEQFPCIQQLANILTSSDLILNFSAMRTARSCTPPAPHRIPPALQGCACCAPDWRILHFPEALLILVQLNDTQTKVLSNLRTTHTSPHNFLIKNQPNKWIRHLALNKLNIYPSKLRLWKYSPQPFCPVNIPPPPWSDSDADLRMMSLDKNGCVTELY